MRLDTAVESAKSLPVQDLDLSAVRARGGKIRRRRAAVRSALGASAALGVGMLWIGLQSVPDERSVTTAGKSETSSIVPAPGTVERSGRLLSSSEVVPGTLRVEWLVDPCAVDSRAELEEQPTQVVVDVVLSYERGMTGACAASGSKRSMIFELQEPLGSRQVVDGAGPPAEGTGDTGTSP